MTSKRLLYTAPVLLASAMLAAQGRGLDPADLLKPLGGRGGGGGGGGVIVGGEGKGDWPIQPDGTIKGTPLMVNDTLYVTTPDNAWALDARDGRELWHFFWKTRGGTHIANSGFGMLASTPRLFMSVTRAWPRKP